MSKKNERKRRSDRREARDQRIAESEKLKMIRVRQAILGYMSRDVYKPISARELCDVMKISTADKDMFYKIIREFIRMDVCVKNKENGTFSLPETSALMTGKISFTKGSGAFVTDPKTKNTVFTPAGCTGTAMHGDTVKVRINQYQSGFGELKEGAVIKKVGSNERTIVGVLQSGRHGHFVVPMQSTIGQNINVPGPANAELNDRVLVRVSEWNDVNETPEGEIVEVIGPADDPALDTLAVMKNFKLSDTFPAECVAEAEAATLTEKDMEGRLDLRKQFIFTIDPATAKDFDDAISLKRQRSGNWQLGVHIADVSHYVTKGSALDKEAYKRATSVYLPDKVVPMLPEQLSNGLCSLRPNEDRLAFSVLITLDDDANVKKVMFRKTVIHSKLRLSYEEALGILENPHEAMSKDKRITQKVVEKVLQVDKLAQNLRHQRMAEGSLMMEIPEAKFVIGEDGRITDVLPVHHDISHQLIEECMLLANECVCKGLSKRKIIQLHRIHEEPDQDMLEKLGVMFTNAGFTPGDLSDRNNLAKMLGKIQHLPQAKAWYINVLKAMKRAEYSTDETVGHYGLAKSYYAHFTSPIRRYPDLITHRLLQALLEKSVIPYEEKQLDKVALQSSEREQIAEEAEREVTDLKIIHFFSEQLAARNLVEYTAFVVDIKAHGLVIDLLEMPVSGMIHVSQLQGDYYEFNQDKIELSGKTSGKTYALGDKLKVIVSKIDRRKKRLDFSIVKGAPEGQDESEQVDRKAKKKKDKKKRQRAKKKKSSKKSK